MKIKQATLFVPAIVAASSLLLACGNNKADSESQATGNSEVLAGQLFETQSTASSIDSVVWAVNVGGPEYNGNDGIVYQADVAGIGGAKAEIAEVLGSQDPQLFKSYRHGELTIQQPMANGLYDVTFKFAEPHDIEPLGRVFDVLVEGQVVIANLAVRNERDGNDKSALVRTVTNVEVTDGVLNLDFEASVGEAILNGLVVRKKQPVEQGWQLLWADEFDYQGAPDPTKWGYDIWPAGKVNAELQAYTNRLQNARVEQGHLIIEAHKETYDNAEYTSARIHAHGKGDFKYGRAEIRAKLPAGQGSWPAIWMLPSDPFTYATTCQSDADWQGSDQCDAWPNSGEIDIMEHVGYDMNRVHGTVHNKAYYWVNWEQRKGAVEGKDVSEAFHVYAMEWTPERIDIYFDDTLYFSYMNEHSGWQAWPFDHPFYLILNIAVGGAWGSAGGPVDDRIFPLQMSVDYVRVYQRAEQQ
ncbi:family 16 glycosylhydrolase [Neiella marina]|uniref:Family 16 glycosylhydrolase n=1 Tax=Neiella holothuriorum TaxID=2870530 RepID=A0ABS7EL30_9GAMM|nr:family 16 glycosylhydrolase [Neiella holothuriorum]MBW8192593.1 family 16 glycosylhydrolase [Neiella holothuriorum]